MKQLFKHTISGCPMLALFLLIGLNFLGSSSFAQSIHLGLPDNILDSVRRAQLLGVDTSGRSYLIRPLNFDAGNQLLKKLYQNPKGNIQVYALPVILQQQINSHHPWGMNDNSMIQAKGYQALVSGGVFAKIGPLSIQLNPEYVYAANSAFDGPEHNANDLDFQKAYARLVYNRIDNPSQFGNGSYTRGSWGQSSIRLNFDPVSFGLSSENLWWGPGVRNSLIMSNNASGFKHLTLNTTRPVDVYVGTIEGQLIGGRLESSGVGVPNLPASYANLYKSKPDDWRYLSGISFTYQPKWVKGLSIGMNRVFMVYSEDMGNSLGDYIPVFNAVNKNKYHNPANGYDEEDASRRDQYFSIFGKWVMPESKAEVYLEYGRNDHGYNTRDYLVEPEHSRAYIAGFRKLVTLPRAEEYVQVGVEFTQLEAPSTSIIRAGPTWYSHHQILHGYTNRGQVLGAGIGPGSNMQSLDVAWVKGIKKIGFNLERIVNNNDFLYTAGEPISEVRRHWVDYAFTGKFAWNWKRIVLNSEMTYIRSLNYQWRLEDNGGFFWDWPKKDANNLHLKVGLLYNFN